MVSNDQRRRQLAREKFLRQQQRRESARRKARTRNTVIASALAVVVVAGAEGVRRRGLRRQGHEGLRGLQAEREPLQGRRPVREARRGQGEVAQLEEGAWLLTIDKSAYYTMNLATTCGAIGIDLKTKEAPHTVNSFNFLAYKGFFDHTKCHRLTTNGIYVLQCGDPKGTGAGARATRSRTRTSRTKA